MMYKDFIFIILLIQCNSLNIKNYNIEDKVEKQSVAILKTNNLANVNESEAELARQYLEEEFSRFKEYGLIERVNLNKILNEINYSQQGIINENTSIRVGRLTGVKNIILSSLSKINSIYVLNCKILDVETGKILNSSTGKVTDISKLDGAAIGCARRLTGRLK